MKGVFIIPTGIGCEIGGHAGDGTPAAKLIAFICDILIIHPNVVNASDINEMSENMLYVEGSILNRFLCGEVGLRPVKHNSILVVVNKVTPSIINAVSAARVTIGADIKILELKISLIMKAYKHNKTATGTLQYIEEAINQIKYYIDDFDVVVVNTPIECDSKSVEEYLSKPGGVNLWGGIEALLSKTMSKELNKPVIHAPVEFNIEYFKNFNKVVDPRKAAEMVSECYIHCCLKGAHKAPKMIYKNELNKTDLINTDIDFMISPDVWGAPHSICYDHNIPIIIVKENKTIYSSIKPDGNKVIITDNYLEATGIIKALDIGITIESICRPIKNTEILNG